jgi:hypothetical protein
MQNRQTPTEYTSVFHPFDAEAVQGKDRMNPLTGEGLHRINAFIGNHLSKGVLNPHSTLAELKVKLNHLNLDFPLTTQTPIEPSNTYEVSHGDVFGAKTDTDLMKGFDRGQDLPKYNLVVNVAKTGEGFQMDGKLIPKDKAIAEAVEHKIKTNKRLGNVKKMIKNKKTK